MNFRGASVGSFDGDLEPLCSASWRVAVPCWFLRVWNRRHLVLFLSDLLAIMVSFVGAYYLRFSFRFLTSIIPF